MSLAVMEDTALAVMTEEELERAEQIIERGQQTFVEVGKALMQIREGKGYRLRAYNTFEDYCRERWGWSRDYGYKLMRAVETIENVDLGIQTSPTYKQALELSRLEPEQQREIAAQVDFGNVTTKELHDIVDQAKAPAHVSYNSGNHEWYTPPEYIEAARQVMGEIDLDPASSDIANKIVKATEYFTAENSGLQYWWVGRVWMNPPYAAELIGQFTEKLANEFMEGSVTQAIVLVNNATETNWFQVMLIHASAVCFPRQRVKFLDMEGNPTGAPLQGQAVLYFGQNAARFAEAFAYFGVVLDGPARHSQE